VIKAELKRCISIERRWNRNEVSRGSPDKEDISIIIIIIIIIIIYGGGVTLCWGGCRCPCAAAVRSASRRRSVARCVAWRAPPPPSGPTNRRRPSGVMASRWTSQLQAASQKDLRHDGAAVRSCSPRDRGLGLEIDRPRPKFCGLGVGLEASI